MAKIKNGHFGSFQGKIGAVTGKKRKGIFYITQSITHNGSNTKRQQIARRIFSGLAKTMGAFAPALAIGFKNLTRPGQVPLNTATGFNYGKVDRTTYTIAPNQIVIARGNYEGIASATFVSPSEGVLKLTWDATVDPASQASDSDSVYLCVYNPDLNKSTLQSAPRSQASISCGYPTSWEGMNVHGYAFVVSPEGKVSDSQYIGQVSCN